MVMTNIKDTRLYEKFKCMICGTKFYRCKKARSGRRLPEGVKKTGAITCSQACSIKYSFIRKR